MRKKNSKSKYKKLWEWFISIPSMRNIALKTPLPLLIIFGLIYVLFSIFSFLSLNHSNFSADNVIGSSILFILGIFTIIFALKDVQFINKLEYKTYMGTLGLSLLIFLFVSMLPLASFYSLGFNHTATIVLFIIDIIIFFLLPLRIFKNRKRLPVYSLDLKTEIITTSKCHPKIIEILKSQPRGRFEILTMSKKEFNKLYPEKNMKIYSIDLKKYDVKMLSVNHKWQRTDYLSEGRGPYSSFTTFFAYQLLNSQNVLCPLSKTMLLCLHRKGYKLLDISVWIELTIRDFLTLIVIGIVIILFIF